MYSPILPGRMEMCLPERSQSWQGLQIPKYSMMYLDDPKIRSAYERRIKDHDRVKHMSELDVKQVAAALSYSAMFIHFT